MKKRTMWAMIPLLLVISCTSATSPNAVCDGLRAPVDQHAIALEADGGDRSVVTGARLIGLFDAACPDGA